MPSALPGVAVPDLTRPVQHHDAGRFYGGLYRIQLPGGDAAQPVGPSESAYFIATSRNLKSAADG